MSTIQNDRNYCSTCKKQLSTGSAYSNHIKSKKHSLKLLESQPFNETKQRLGNSNYINANITNSFDYINSEYDNEEYYSKEHDGEEYNNEEVKYIFFYLFIFFILKKYAYILKLPVNRRQ